MSLFSARPARFGGLILCLGLLWACPRARAADSAGNELSAGWRVFLSFGSTILRNTDAQGFLTQIPSGAQAPQTSFGDAEQFGAGMEWQRPDGWGSELGVDFGQPWQAQATYADPNGQFDDYQLNQQWFLSSLYFSPGYTWITDAQGTAFLGLRLEEGYLAGSSQVVDGLDHLSGTRNFSSAAFGFGPVLRVERVLSTFPHMSWSLNLGYRFLTFPGVWVNSSSGDFASSGPGASLADLGNGFKPDLSGFFFRLSLAWGPRPLTHLEKVESLGPSPASSSPAPPKISRP